MRSELPIIEDHNLLNEPTNFVYFSDLESKPKPNMKNFKRKLLERKKFKQDCRTYAKKWMPICEIENIAE